MVDFGFAVRANLFTALTSTTDKPKLNIWVYMNIFPIAAWSAILGSVIVSAVWFSVSNKQGPDLKLNVSIIKLLNILHLTSSCLLFENEYQGEIIHTTLNKHKSIEFGPSRSLRAWE